MTDTQSSNQSCEHGVPLRAVPRCTQCQDYFDPLNRDDVVAECKRLRAAWAGIFGERDRDNAAQWVADLLRNQRPAAETTVGKVERGCWLSNQVPRCPYYPSCACGNAEKTFDELAPRPAHCKLPMPQLPEPDPCEWPNCGCAAPDVSGKP